MLKQRLFFRAMIGRRRRSLRTRLYSTDVAGPLRILFCGSDHFSIKSLEALQNERVADPDFIESIDVVCRPGKWTGRGLKTIREGSSPQRLSTIHTEKI